MKYIMTFESYQSYSDYEKGKSKTGPAEMKKDATLTLKRLLPTFDEKWIDSVEDQSTDKGIKFEFKIGKDTVHMFKVGRWLGQWELYLNRKKSTESDIRTQLENSNMSALDKFLKYAPGYDYYSQYIDDGGQYRRAESNNQSVINMFNDLSSSDKKKALKALKKNGGASIEDIDRVFGSKL